MSGGFRCGWLARLTRGRIGLGRWTAEEVADIERRARQDLDASAPYVDAPTPTHRPARATTPQEES